LIDLSVLIRKSIESKKAWTDSQIEYTLQTLCKAMPSSSLEWDKDCGEQWARIFVGEKVQAIVSVPLPLLVVLREAQTFLSGYSVDPRVVKIVVESFEAETYSLSDDLAIELNQGRKVTSSFDSRCFSINSLWWATV
jgi:hypothetical protein